MPSGFTDALLYFKRTLSFRSRLSLRNRLRRRRLRRPIKISAPIPHDSMELDANATVDGFATRPESGVFYLVPNKHGKGKTIVRRAGRPLSSTPLNEDFDAVTQGGTTSKGAATTVGTSRRRPILAIRTTSPFVEKDEGSVGRMTTPRPRFDPMRVFRNSFRTKTPREAPAVNGRQWKGKERATDDNGEIDHKAAAKAMGIREWLKGKSGSDIHRAATLPARRLEDSGTPSHPMKTRQTVGGVKDLFRDRHAGSSTRDRGPKPGQRYEMINRRIVENSEDRTVEISMWKQHTPGEVRPEDADRMSIYYLSADDYAREVEGNTLVEWMVADPATNGQTHQSLSNSGTKMDPPQSPPRMEPRRQRPEQSRAVHRREGTISPSTSEKEGSPVAKGPSRSITQSRRSPPLPPLPLSSQRKEKRRYKESTPIEKDLPRSPFNPTDSGSTISSIKSASILELEGVLAECEPSLVHIAPILKSLGIRSVDHLKAVARLTPTTRDREVKEDALRLGITVMEWAIFVDKIFAL
ncbi:unnamed protein product [Cyclocybe aegerita]|uniref:Uncharacterized protein n=1 Tax=Cyclocybe aegerita TaxID=1973307 RepID=A0A8S0WQD1_CYCAE|nr:unnamed protein product [Cyclocybe aegerita]